MEFTVDEAKELDKLISKIRPMPVKGGYLWKHLREYFWFEKYGVSVENQSPFVVDLIRERNQLKRDLDYLSAIILGKGTK